MNHERRIKIQEYLNRCATGDKAVTLKDIQEYLYESGLENVSVLTIQRDIEHLINMGENI